MKVSMKRVRRFQNCGYPWQKKEFFADRLPKEPLSRFDARLMKSVYNRTKKDEVWTYRFIGVMKMKALFQRVE